MGACVHCKSLKVRCKFDPGESSCQRCIAGSHECLVRGRKKRKPAPTHEALLEKSHQQDTYIQCILEQLDQIKTEKKIKDWIEKAQGETSSSSTCVPVFLDGYLAILCAPDARHFGISQALPEVVKRGLLQMDEVHDLFRLVIGHPHGQPFFSILDPNYHTPPSLIHTSPFLFTVVCTVASRYYDLHPQLYPLLMSFARDAAGKALVDSSKTVETCQAYLLLAVYPKPRKRWAEDRSWALMGVAIRLALELRINQPQPTPPTPTSLNHTRTWLNAFCVDASHATQYGKLPMVRLQDDYVARHSADWWRCSERNLDYDIHLCGYVDILLVMAEFRRIVDEEGEDPEGDLVGKLVEIDRRLHGKIGHWYHLYQTQTFSTDPICRYRGNTTRLIAAYSRLVVLAHTFQLGLKKGLKRENYIVRESIAVAQLVLQIMINDMYPVVYPTRMLRFSMEAHFLYVAYAAAFLLNLLRPRCKPLLEPAEETKIISSVRKLIEILGSNEVALDGRHTPMLYSRFLSSLLAKYDHSVASAPGEATYAETQYAPDGQYSPPSGEILPQYNRERDPTPPHMYYWPDTSQSMSGASHVMEQSAQDYPSGTVYQQSGDADMDFSMNHFLQTVVAGHSTGTYGAQFHGNMAPAQVMDDRWGMPGSASDLFGTNYSDVASGWPHATEHDQSSQYGQPWTGMRS
ncbi:hypothetical protein NEOLEDRAFT_1058377 [Neolentinus lepideus HHB14362 ss-1]|uniref:Zn(2)-C6 fungal-type domain-containing protein n=1 Tax=Neolentinus lepideus HHB14362 ss-1 TaxID=1314782 RepID=A0A165UP28_9AGAM|nr:hypothetical protein NEOLEDRAFT_1058377 [Neolentinus lepideus HHB14362 ss-1]